MAIALVESQFGPTSTQNLQFFMFLTYFWLFWPFPGSPIAIPYSLSLFPFHSPCPCPIGSCQGLQRETIHDHFFSVPLVEPFFMSPLLMFFKNYFFLPCGVPQGPFFFGQNSILKKLNKFLFHFYMVFAYVFQKLFFLAVRRPAGAFFQPKLYLEKIE